MTGASTEIVNIPVVGGVLEAELRGGISSNASPPIVFLHGWTLDRRMWAQQMKALAAEHPVIAFDRRGFGQSTAPAGIDLEPDDIIAVQDYFSLQASVVVGMSQAGRIALEFALRRPQRTIGLILEGAGLSGFKPAAKPDEQIPLGHYRSLLEAGQIDKMRKEWREHPLMQSPNPDAVKCMDDMLRSYDGRDLRTPLSSSFGVDPDALGKIQSPVLAVTGDQETPWRRLVADAIAYGVPDARRATVKNAGHVCNLCNPEGFNAIIGAFLAELHK
ncbi:alpha/beta fold hydrolase [Marinicaulis aureus]|uniref:Alpha/beta fold hydrolase n=1 Tax=Hyphococcus aureus TaxID=2666033 RepID=A0ABW1KUB8_9PROT